MADKRILLVEDNPDDEKLMLRALKKNNIANKIVVARDGAEALDMLVGARIEPFALVLLDLRLPKVHGLEVLKQFRSHPAGKVTPVVILTSSKEESDMMASYQSGANSYVRKPIDFQKFMEVVSQLGMYWLMVNEAPLNNGER